MNRNNKFQCLSVFSHMIYRCEDLTLNNEAKLNVLQENTSGMFWHVYN